MKKSFNLIIISLILILLPLNLVSCFGARSRNDDVESFKDEVLGGIQKNEWYNNISQAKQLALFNKQLAISNLNNSIYLSNNKLDFSDKYELIGYGTNISTEVRYMTSNYYLTYQADDTQLSCAKMKSNSDGEYTATEAQMWHFKNYNFFGNITVIGDDLYVTLENTINHHKSLYDITPYNTKLPPPAGLEGFLKPNPNDTNINYAIKSNNFWLLGTDKGLYITSDFSTFTSVPETKNLNINSIIQNSQNPNEYYLATNNGLWKCVSNKYLSTFTVTEIKNTETKNINNVIQIKNGYLLFTVPNSGLYKLDPSSTKAVQLKSNNIKTNTNVKSLVDYNATLSDETILLTEDNILIMDNAQLD